MSIKHRFAAALIVAFLGGWVIMLTAVTLPLVGVLSVQSAPSVGLQAAAVFTVIVCISFFGSEVYPFR